MLCFPAMSLSLEWPISPCLIGYIWSLKQKKLHQGALHCCSDFNTQYALLQVDTVSWQKCCSNYKLIVFSCPLEFEISNWACQFYASKALSLNMKNKVLKRSRFFPVVMFSLCGCQANRKPCRLHFNKSFNNTPGKALDMWRKPTKMCIWIFVDQII